MEKRRKFTSLTDEERHEISLKAINGIIKFLELFMPNALAKRLISIILIISGVKTKKITLLTGSCERSVRIWKNKIANGEIDDLLEISGGRGRKSKFSEIKSQVLGELESGNYQTLQQIADMVQDKFGVKVSLMAVHRLLKKTTTVS